MDRWKRVMLWVAFVAAVAVVPAAVVGVVWLLGGGVLVPN